AGAARLPRLSVFGTTSSYDTLGSLPGPALAAATQGHTTSAQIGLSASIPLYQGGGPAAQVRQAQASEGAAFEREISTERQVIATVRA
ncbi:TolC family protein, partial [Salmonella enterica]|uniref:TolC family protein n=1 Tax=Salmonella enterica TaxID=28901 RepID=UPI003D29F96A